MLLIVAISTVSFGQKGKEFDPEKKAEMLTEKMTKKLELNEDQQKAVYAANLKMIQEKEEIHEQMKANRKAHMEAMSKVLTKEQLEKIEKKKGRKKDCCDKGMRKRKDKKGEKTEDESEKEG